MRRWKVSYGELPLLLRLVAHARASARRRSAHATTGRRVARAIHCHRSVRGPGRRPSPTPSASPETFVDALASMSFDMRMRPCESGDRRSRQNASAIRQERADPRMGPGDRSATRRIAAHACFCKSPRIGPRASTSADRTLSKQARPPIPPHGRKVDDTAMPEFGDEQGPRSPSVASSLQGAGSAGRSRRASCQRRCRAGDKHARGESRDCARRPAPLLLRRFRGYRGTGLDLPSAQGGAQPRQSARSCAGDRDDRGVNVELPRARRRRDEAKQTSAAVPPATQAGRKMLRRVLYSRIAGSSHG